VQLSIAINRFHNAELTTRSLRESEDKLMAFRERIAPNTSRRFLTLRAESCSLV